VRALITGATGFIGRYLVGQLKTQGYSCRCLVRSRPQAEVIPALEGTELVEGDITEPQSLSGVASGVDHVFHLAGAGHVSAIAEESYRRFEQINVQGAQNVVRACAEAGLTRLVHFSSTAAMGLIRRRLVDETTPCQPSTPYQRSKYHGEVAVLDMARKTDCPVVIIRPCMVIGAGGRGEFWKMVSLMARGRFPKVGRGANLTPVIHVRDVVNGTILAAERGIPGEVYLLVGGSYPMDEIRHLVVENLGTPPGYPYLPTWLVLWGVWAIELQARLTGRVPIVTRRNIVSTVVDRVFSIEKARQHLGFTPQVSLEEAIRETVTWYQARGIL